MEVRELTSRTDFRLEKIGETPAYFTPDDESARAELDKLFARLTGGARPRSATLSVQGHPVEVPAQAMGVARFSFDDLCRKPLGAADYIAIARAYHTVLVDGIPRLGGEQRNEAKRFINLIDVLYERHVKLFASAETEPDQLYGGERGAEAFEFARTTSRLHEMRSRDYLARPRGRGHAVSGDTTGLVET
jgi:cell division protein ZapE